MTRSGKFADDDKSKKFAYVIYLLQTLDKDIKRGENPSKVLKAMLINDCNEIVGGNSFGINVVPDIGHVILFLSQYEGILPVRRA